MWRSGQRRGVVFHRSRFKPRRILCMEVAIGRAGRFFIAHGFTIDQQANVLVFAASARIFRAGANVGSRGSIGRERNGNVHFCGRHGGRSSR